MVGGSRWDRECWVLSLAVAAGTPGLGETPLFLPASVSPSVKWSQQQLFASDA